MFQTFKNAWAVRDLRKKMMFVLLVIAIYRLGSQIPLPGISLSTMAAAKSAAGAGTLYNMIASGGYGSIFALGIGPYITASIIMQLLTVAISPLEQLQKEGQEGRNKINQYTRVLALVLAFFQAFGQVVNLRPYFAYPGTLTYIMATCSIVVGTLFIMWLAELINEKGIGNGTSFIIFANILSGLPRAAMSLYNHAMNGGAMGVVTVVAILIIFIAIIYFVVGIQGGERRLPVKYSKREGARKSFVTNDQYIPLKVNIAGVMSIIFAISLLQFPTILGQFFSAPWLARAAAFLDMTSISGAIIYVVLIFFFTFFYTSFAINPAEMAENMKKNASFIPGIRPGKPTADYIDRTVYRLSWIGACFYSLIATTPIILQWIFKIEVGFGGTTLLIVTGVCLDLVKQMETQLLTRHYKGFLD